MMEQGMRIGGVLGVVALCATVALGAAEDAEAQLRFPARTFNADVSLSVSVQVKADGEWQEIGRTPATEPLKIPACHMWWVMPRSGTPLASVVAAVRRERIPALNLFYRAVDRDLELLQDLTALQGLSLAWS